MSTHIHYEKNSMRKSHRITIPIKIHIDNIIYDSLDWSMTGISIKQVQSKEFVIGHIYDGVLMLGLKDATISLRVKVKCIYLKDKKYGFEFVELSQKNRKVLRRYLELYLDGKLDNVGDLMAIHDEPDINTAIQEPLKLNDDEKRGLEKSFFRKSIGAILLSLLLLFAIAALLYQNLRYKYERVGIVESNYKVIYPQNDGVVEKIYFKVGDKVRKGDILVDLNSDKIIHEIKVLESIKKARIKEKQLHKSFQKKVAGRFTDSGELLSIERKIVKDSYEDLKNAQIQYKNHIITRSTFLDIKKNYLDAKERFAYYKRQNEYQKNSNLPTPKVVNIEEIELKIANKKRLLEDLRIFSPYSGVVYEVNAKERDVVSKKDSLITLWTLNTPQIIVTLSAYKAVDLRVGEEVEIVDSLDMNKFNGIVKKINDSSFDNDLKIATTKKANEVFVTIEPQEGATVLLPHSIVKVFFKRNFGF